MATEAQRLHDDRIGYVLVRGIEGTEVVLAASTKGRGYVYEVRLHDRAQAQTICDALNRAFADPVWHIRADGVGPLHDFGD